MDENTGYYVGGNLTGSIFSYLFKTEDGGNSWELIYNPPSSHEIYQIDFIE